MKADAGTGLPQGAGRRGPATAAFRRRHRWPRRCARRPQAHFDTCDLISAKLPDLKLCLSTNGLALPDHVDAIKVRNIHHLTITINAIDPVIAERIYSWVFHDHKRWSGRDAARILIEWQGLDLAVAAGLLVKVNPDYAPSSANS